MDINAYLASQHAIGAESRGEFAHVPHAKRITCVDGFSLSVQASRYHYCSPRTDVGPWVSVEVGYPSQRSESLMTYVDDQQAEPTQTVYGWVPVEIVDALIQEHGGLS